MISSPSITLNLKSDPRFDYNTEADLDIHEVGEEVFDGKVVHDISYRGASGRTINAYMVTPTVGKGFPAILFVHPLPGSRKTFLDEALKLADLRICSLMVDAAWSAGMEWAKDMGNPDHDRAEFIDSVKDLRRAIDVLMSEPMVDGERLGYVGHSLGALCGALITSIDRRARAYVLMSGTVSFADVATASIPNITKEEVARYRGKVEDIDPVRFVPHAAPASVMLQMGTREEYFGHDRMQSLADAASDPKVVKWYDSGHALDEQARMDRDHWLADELFR